MGLVRQLVIPPGCPRREMEMGKVTAKPDPLGVETAAGAEEVEARPTLAGSGLIPRAGAEEEEARLKLVVSSLKPGGGAVEVWKRDTPVAMPAGTGVRGTPPKTGAVAVDAGPMPKPPVGRIQGRAGTSGGTIAGAAMDAVEALGNRVFPNKLRKVVRSSLGSGGQGTMILMQVLGTLSRACCMTVANLKFVK